MNIVDTDKMEQGATLLLEGLGLNLNDPNLKGTPQRIARAWIEMCNGLWAQHKIADLFSAVFPSKYDQMIVVRNIDAVGICPHHFLPVTMRVHIGYIPNGEGKVVGLSKLARLAKIMAARPVLQEDLPEDIANVLEEYLGPAGVGVIIEAGHACMQCRGVLARGTDVATSVLRGAFREHHAVRDEFWRLAGV